MDLNIYNILLIVSVIALLILAIQYYSLTKTVSKISVELNESRKRFDIYKNKMEPLSKYLSIADAEEEAKKIRAEAKKIRDGLQFDYNIKIAEANKIAESVLNDSRTKAKEIHMKAEQHLQEVYALANKSENEANVKYDSIIHDSRTKNQSKRNSHES